MMSLSLLVQQFHAHQLDADIADLFAGKLAANLQLFDVLTIDYEPEITAIIPAILELVGLTLHRQTYGQYLTGIKVKQETGSLFRRYKHLLRPLLVFIVSYGYKRGIQLMLQHRFHLAGSGTWKRRSLRLLVMVEKLSVVMRTLHHFVFIGKGIYPTIADRVLQITVCPDGKSDFEALSRWMIREAVWRGLHRLIRLLGSLNAFSPALWVKVLRSAMRFAGLQQVLSSLLPRQENEVDGGRGELDADVLRADSLGMQGHVGQVGASSIQPVSSNEPAHAILGEARESVETSRRGSAAFNRERERRRRKRQDMKCFLCHNRCITVPCHGVCDHFVCYACAAREFLVNKTLRCTICHSESLPDDLRAVSKLAPSLQLLAASRSDAS